MKNHLTVILLALRGAVMAAAAWAILHLMGAKAILTYPEPDIVKINLGEYFFPKAWENFYNYKWQAAAFCIVYALLLGYLIFGIIRLYRCLTKIEKGQMFYSTQGNDFRKAGANIILFAKAKYVLFALMGWGFYGDPSVLYRQIPSFLAIYLIGKLILLISSMAEKGGFVQQENELTI